MCSVCGCGDTKLTGNPHVHSDEHTHAHTHVMTSKLIDVEKSILSANKAYAEQNRAYFKRNAILSFNLLSSPGSGKTTLLVKTIENLSKVFNFYVIEGDQQTSMDAERIQATGAPALQINTGKGCHLDAHMIGHAAEDLSIQNNSILFIENVGNLVCPADFDLGEFARVVVLSVTEGEDKPLKYPNIFYDADIILLNKSDLLPYLDFNTDLCEGNIRKVNPSAKILYISAKTGEGLSEWYSWLHDEYAKAI